METKSPRLSIEQKGLLKTPEQKTVRIGELVADRPEVAGLQTYEYLGNKAKAGFEAFINSGEGHLRLGEYNSLSRKKLEDLAVAMEEAMASLVVGEHDAKSHALFNALEYRVSELFLLMMAADANNPSLSDEARAEALDWYKQANETVYGHPDPELFVALVKRDMMPVPVGGQGAQLHTEMHNLIGKLPEIDREVYKPSAELKTRVEGLVRERFASLVSHIEPSKKYTRQEAKATLNEVLDRIEGARDLGWQIVDKPGSSTLAVSSHQKMIEFGADRDDMDGEELVQKSIHELGIHVTRAVNAMRAGWLSAAYGQEGYLDFEESLANVLSEAYSGKYKNDGSKYYLAIGLALGQDGHPPRDDREVFEIMWRQLAIKEAGPGKEVTESNIAKGKKDAALLCMRIYRGTSGDMPGVVYSKDLSYFRGQQRVWQVLENVHTPADLERLLLGKLDNSVEDHQVIAAEIERALAKV